MSELTTAVEKFMELHGAKSDQKSEVSAPTATNVKPNILIALPCYGGNIHCTTVNMLMSLTGLLTTADIPHETHFVVESLIPRARNQLASIAAFSTDADGRPYSHLMFLDSDVSFDAEWVLKMLKANLPIVALPYSRKVLDMTMVAEAAKRNINPANLLAFAGTPIILPVDESPFTVSDKPVAVRYAGTGAMLISVEKVLKPLAEAHPERRYRTNVPYDKNLEWSFDYFRCDIRDDNYLGEDHFFLEDVKSDLDILPHIIPSARTLHAGVQIFELNMLALASLHSVIEQESTNAAQSA